MTTLLPGVQMGAPAPGNLAISNSSYAQQAPAAATRTYINGTALQTPGGLKVGQKFKWRFNMAKTGAGTATSTIDIAVGAAGTTSDTARVSFTKPAGTAAADEGVVTVEAVVTAVSNTAGGMRGEFTLIHNLAATGHAQIPCVVVYAASAAFDNDNNDLYVGLCITTGAADVITIEWAEGETFNVKNQAN